MRQCRLQRLVGLFMTLLMVSYLACLSLCQHTHVVGNRVFTHSHPYKSSSHTHSGSGLTLIKSLSDFSALISDENAELKPFFSLICEVNSLNSLHVEPFYLALLSLRAPPFI